MTVELNQDDKIEISASTKKTILRNNLNKIEQLNNDTYYCNKSMNFYGRQLVYYMCNNSYLDLNNPEITDLSKNTLAKVLSRIKIIDNYIQKPLEKYTSRDMNDFINDFVQGSIKSLGNRAIEKDAIKYYLIEFKRLWRIYRQYRLNNDSKIDYLQFEWGLNIRPPKINKKRYEKFPNLRIDEMIELSKMLHKEEYTVRMLLSINLMGRKCEMTSLTYRDIDIHSDNKIWIQLPDIKKHSSEKVPVEVWSVVKTPLYRYLHKIQFRKDDLIFPSKETAFAKNLKEISERILKHRITPKTLRKLGVSAAEQLKFSRSDVERIGGWRANSDILNHYFARKRVAARTEEEQQLDKVLYSDIYQEFEKVKNENRKVSEVLAGLEEKEKRLEKALLIIEGFKKNQIKT